MGRGGDWGSEDRAGGVKARTQEPPGSALTLLPHTKYTGWRPRISPIHTVSWAAEILGSLFGVSPELTGCFCPGTNKSSVTGATALDARASKFSQKALQAPQIAWVCSTLFCFDMKVWIPLVCRIHPRAWHMVHTHPAQVPACDKCSTSIGLATPLVEGCCLLSTHLARVPACGKCLASTDLAHIGHFLSTEPLTQ